MTIIEKFRKPLYVNHCRPGDVFGHKGEYWLVSAESRAGIVEAVNLKNGRRGDFDYSVEVSLYEAELHVKGAE